MIRLPTTRFPVIRLPMIRLLTFRFLMIKLPISFRAIKLQVIRLKVTRHLFPINKLMFNHFLSPDKLTLGNQLNKPLTLTTLPVIYHRTSNIKDSVCPRLVSTTNSPE